MYLFLVVVAVMYVSSFSVGMLPLYSTLDDRRLSWSSRKLSHTLGITEESQSLYYIDSVPGSCNIYFNYRDLLYRGRSITAGIITGFTACGYCFHWSYCFHLQSLESLAALRDHSFHCNHCFIDHHLIRSCKYDMPFPLSLLSEHFEKYIAS